MSLIIIDSEGVKTLKNSLMIGVTNELTISIPGMKKRMEGPAVYAESVLPEVEKVLGQPVAVLRKKGESKADLIERLHPLCGDYEVVGYKDQFVLRPMTTIDI